MQEPAVDTATPIVVLTIRPNPVQPRALPIARSAGRLGIPVHSLSAGRLGPAGRSRFVREEHVMPANASPEQCVDSLLSLGARLGKAVLVPLDDAGTLLVDEHGDVLAERFLFPRRPPTVTRLLSSKRELHLLCDRTGVPRPEAVFPGDATEALELAKEFGYPVVAKIIDGWVPTTARGAPSVHIASDPDDLRAAFTGMDSASGGNVMLQEYVPGPPQSVWMFNGYFDERSEALVGFTGRKLRQYPPYSGATTLGICLTNYEVDASMRRLMAEVGYRGMVDSGFRFDARDGAYKLLDVNPRIGATFRLFVGEDGMDVLRAAYLDLTGQDVPASRQREGRRWMAEPLDAASSFRYWQAGELTPRGWARSLRGVQEAAWLAADDPLPAAALTAPLARAGARRVGRALRALPSRARQSS